jgi:glycosyltransferase involved in cell wall biosynthesis
MPQLISVVVPVFNNQPTLEETCRQIMEVHQSSFGELELEIIFVNDGSTDGSWQELERLQRLHKETVSLINLSRNFGQLGALYAGFNHARGDAVICVSADLQDPIQLMAKMVAYWKSGTEIVICYREKRNDGFLARKSSNLAYSIARISNPGLPKGGFDYWLMNKKICKMLCSFKGRHNFLQGYLVSVGFSKAFIPYTRVQRAVGKSGYNFARKLKIVIDFLVDSSYLPIRFMSSFGALISLCSVIYSFLIIYAWLVNQTPFPGWAPLIIVTMLMSGILMMMLGVIGEYIWRIHDNLRDFPLFIVESKSMSGGDESSK